MRAAVVVLLALLVGACCFQLQAARNRNTCPVEAPTATPSPTNAPRA